MFFTYFWLKFEAIVISPAFMALGLRHKPLRLTTRLFHS